MEYGKLRPHQQKAVSLLRAEWKDKRTHLVYGPVGMGKTALASYIIGSFVEKGMRCLFIAPYTVLVEQTAARFKEYGLPDPGIIWRDHPEYFPSRMVQIASADTLLRREWPENIDLVFVDECHIKRAKLLEIIRDIDIPVIGLSGTPFPPWIGEYYQSLIKPCSMRELIDNGYLSDYEFYAPTKPNLSSVKTRMSAGFGQDYVESEVAAIMGDSTLVGDIVVNWLENGRNLPTITFCCNVAHANEVTNQFISAGVECEVMTAKTPKDDRTQIINRFEDGVTKIICNVGVLVAGFDSDVRCIIYARPTKSEIRWIQCLGRGLRSAKGKDTCLIFDHSGSVHRLGFPDQIDYDELPNGNDGLSKQEINIKEKERLEKLPRECPRCKQIKPVGSGPVCKKCGYIARGGEDVDTDTTRKLESLNKKNTQPTKADKQSIYSQLLGYQKERRISGRPLSDGAIAHMYKRKFGVWPRNLNSSAKVPGIELRNWIISQQIRYAKGRSKNTSKKAMDAALNTAR